MKANLAAKTKQMTIKLRAKRDSENDKQEMLALAESTGRKRRAAFSAEKPVPVSVQAARLKAKRIAEEKEKQSHSERLDKSEEKRISKWDIVKPTETRWREQNGVKEDQKVFLVTGFTH